MREITIPAKNVKVFTYDELSEDAKQAVKDSWAMHNGYNSSDEAIDSLNAIAEHFGGKVLDYQVDFFGSTYSSCKFDMAGTDDDEVEELLDELGSYNPDTLKGHGECKLTGTWSDEPLIDGFRKAWFDGERDIYRLMDKAFDSWFKVCQEDCEYQYSDEAMSENCEANEYEFYEDGSMV